MDQFGDLVRLRRADDGDRQPQNLDRLMALPLDPVRAPTIGLDPERAAGVGEDGYPKLAIAHATAEKCYLSYQARGAVRMAANPWVRDSEHRQYIDFPEGSFSPPGRERPNWSRAEAIAPIIPIDVRRKRGLENYRILWEAVWRRAPPG